MSVEIKICGVNDADFAVEAERLGADFLGFLFAEESPRRVTVGFVRSVRHRLRGTARCVGVFTTASVGEIVRCARACRLEIVQVHRRATAEEVAALRTAGFEVWTLAGGAEGDAVLFDSSHGDGERDLRRGPYKAVLAGGIGAENIAQAMRSGAEIVDVSGSLERTRGVKSVARLREFFKVVGKLNTERSRRC